MRYADFHPECSDVKTYFDRVEERFDLAPGPSMGHIPTVAAGPKDVKNA
jgi:hypothetical protein